MKKALIIGIDDYPKNNLTGCVRDANEMAELLQKNEDGTDNFSVQYLTNSNATQRQIRQALKELFSTKSCEIALLYFAGHGVDDDRDGVIVTIDYEDGDYGVRMEEILTLANRSKSKNKVIIFDCCHSGLMGNSGIVGDNSVLSEGMTILTACKRDELASEIVNGHGVFSNLLSEALRGGAADILGKVTPGSIYAYIDQALGTTEQRPVFKTHVSSFIVLREVKPKISPASLYKIIDYFVKPNDEYKLDPSYESTNIKGGEHKNMPPYAKNENVKVLENLQKYNRHGLLVPVEDEHLYDAVMNSHSCKLTALGQHYWRLVSKKLI